VAASQRFRSLVRAKSAPLNAPIATVVVDDEPLALQRVLSLLRTDGDIRVTGAFRSARRAAHVARKHPPQLMLLDICMPELDGFEMVHTLARSGVRPHVIFVTATAERSMEAFAAGAIDYLLKPFDEERFARALERAKSLIRANPVAAAAAAGPVATAGGRTRLLLSEHGKVVVLSMRDIEFVQAAAKRVKIYAGGRCFSFRHGLTQLEERLDPASFVRVHRSTLVNVEHIAEMHPLFHGDCELVLRRGTRLTLSRRYRARLAPFLIG
jgi:two-component system LytT family response regulator